MTGRIRMAENPRHRIPAALLAALAAVSLAGAVHAKDPAPAAKHIILFIADGMQPENESAAGRYLAGKEDGLSFHAFPYRGWVATWDVNVYNRQAARAGAPPYSPSSIRPKLGCDAHPAGRDPVRGSGPRYT
ncbi:MAG: hypothetical protein WBJ58_10000, partial [Syntrophales bacterium]